MKLAFIILSALLIGACTEKPSLCQCMKNSIDINKELKSSLNDEKKIRLLNEQNTTKMEACNELLKKLSASEKEDMAVEAKKCQYYPEFLKLF